MYLLWYIGDNLLFQTCTRTVQVTVRRVTHLIMVHQVAVAGVMSVIVLVLSGCSDGSAPVHLGGILPNSYGGGEDSSGDGQGPDGAVVDGAVVVHAGATVVTLNATTAALISVQRVATGSPAIEFLPHGFAGVPLFTLALTRPSDFGGPLQVQSSDFRSFLHSAPSTFTVLDLTAHTSEASSSPCTAHCVPVYMHAYSIYGVAVRVVSGVRVTGCI